MKYFSSSLRITLSIAGGMVLGAAMIASGASSRGSIFFPDVPTGSYFDDAVGEMYDLGVVKGYESGKFGPNDYVTRAQVAVMMKRLRDEIKGIVAEAPVQPIREALQKKDEGDDDDDAIAAPRPIPVVTKNPAGFLRFTIDRYSVDEDDGRATISVIRTGGTKGAVVIKYVLADGTAKAGEDYEAGSGELRFGDGESSKTFAVAIKDDTASEGNETILLSLSEPTGGASLGAPIQATLTIDDNEEVAGGSSGGTSTSGSSSGGSSTSTDAGVFAFGAQSYTIGENVSSITIAVGRSYGSKGVAGVNYATQDSTSKSPGDYTATNGTLSFADGETSKTFTVTIIDDSATEGNKKLNLILSNPTGGAKIADLSTVELTIADNEVVSFGSGSVRFGKSSYTVSEKGGNAIITIERVGGAKGTASVKYMTSNNNAKFGEDYVKTEGTMTFLEGETKKTFAVPIIADEVNDPDERIALFLNTSVGTALASPEESEIIIQQ